LWTDIATAVTSRSFTATGLQSGLTYKFRVYARNAVGYGLPSSSVTILTAIVPSAPLAPTTSVSANHILIKWTSPSADSQVEYGARITGFSVMVQNGDFT